MSERAVQSEADDALRPYRIREHQIPTARSQPYICVEGPDRALWFCESGANRIGRFDPQTRTFSEFVLPHAR